MVRVSDFKGVLNPRWVCWMVSRGEDPATFELTPRGEDCPRVVDPTDGKLYPRPMVFSQWVMARWTEWARSLGFTHGTQGRWLHEEPLACGHTHEEFDAWLRAKVGVEA